MSEYDQLVSPPDFYRSFASFLSTTRRMNNFGLSIDRFKAIYSSICSRAVLMPSFINSEFDHSELPILIPILSTSREVFTTKFHNKKVIVYDQYIGELFIVLNHIFFFSKNPNNILTLTCKIFSERLRDKLNLWAAMNFGQLFQTGLQKNRFPDLNKERIELYTIIQETFLIAHEFAHIVFKENIKLWDYFSQRAKEDATYCIEKHKRVSEKTAKNVSEQYGFDEMELLLSWAT